MYVFGWKENRSPTNVLYMIPSEVKPFLRMCKHGPVPAKSFEGTLQMSSLSRYAVSIVLFSSAVMSLFKRNDTRKQEADWKAGRESVDQQPQ